MTQPVNKPIISISSSGECPRAASARLLQRPEVLDPVSKKRLELAAREGTRWEAFVLEDLATDHGYTVVETPYCAPCDRNGYHVEVDIGRALLVGHIDGFAPPALVEVKTMSRFQFERWKKQGFDAFRKYAFQVSLYMIAMHCPAVYAVKNRDTGELDVREIVEPPLSMAEIVNYLGDALRAYNNGVLADCPETDQYPCGFCYTKIGTVPVDRGNTPGLPSEAEVATAITNWRAGKALELEASRLVDPAKQVLYDYLTSSGQKSISFDGLYVTRVGDSYTKAPDKDLLLAALGREEYEKVQKESLRKGYVKITDERGGQ